MKTKQIVAMEVADKRTRDGGMLKPLVKKARSIEHAMSDDDDNHG